MEHVNHLEQLREFGRMTWAERAHGWLVEPQQVLDALVSEGFQEYKHEVARSGHNRGVTGGMWEGLNPRNGSVASAIWVNRRENEKTLVFIDINGEPLTGDRRGAADGRAA